MPADDTTLPPRKRLRATATAPTWHSHLITDHTGDPAHIVWFGSSASPPATASFQLYTTFRAPADPVTARAAALSHVRLLADRPDFLSRYSDRDDDESSSPLRFDVYDGEPDVLACVDHQRREIRSRRDEIPRFAASSYESPRGLAIVLTAEVDADEVQMRVKEEPDREAEDGPVFVWFERGGGKNVRVPRDLEVEDGGELALERVEVVAQRVRTWGSVEGEMMRVLVVEGFGSPEEEDAADGDEREEDRKVAAEGPQLQTSFKVDAGGHRTVVVHNTDPASPSDAHLHYLVYDLVGDANSGSTRLAGLAADDDDALATVAQSFTLDLLTHLHPTTTILLEFHRAPSLTASIQHCRREQRARPELSVGYLPQTADNPPSPHRIFPSSPLIETGIDRHRAATVGNGAQQSGFATFLVALESRDWMREDAVLLVRAEPDIMALRRLMGSASNDGAAALGKAVEVLVGRPPGLEVVAKRLSGIL